MGSVDLSLVQAETAKGAFSEYLMGWRKKVKKGEDTVKLSGVHRMASAAGPGS